ncbi:MAG: TIGR02584 family CRISPR-associated protein [Kiritimatiellae bacterium]|nr:TIGR02584 family CRISPR-associated protein [Kiritimatiellia bacterium]
MEKDKKAVLVAVVGTTPSILTETAWALAHCDVPVVPDEVVAITTKSGKRCLCEALLEGGVWNDMLACMKRSGLDVEGRLVFGSASIRAIPDAHGNEIDDLRTGDDNLRAANFMLSQLRQFTEDCGTELHVSIAGGRKTMSALMFSCMTLLGRDCDKVYHVLLPPALEGGSEPPFFFPKKGTRYKSLLTGKSHAGASLKSELFEVPYVRMRGWYQEKFKSLPPNYGTLVSRVQEVAPPAVVYPEIEIDAWNGWVTLDGATVPMSRPCFATLLLIAGGCPIRDLHRRLLALHGTENHASGKCDWIATFQEGSLFSNEKFAEDLTKTMSNLRKSLAAAGFTAVETLVPKRNAPVTFPLQRIKWRNREIVADVCGCPDLIKESHFLV